MALNVALSFLQRVVEEKIREAQEAGAFDNLPGAGKPLKLEDLSWVPEDLRVAYTILKNAHVLPPEVELLKQIRTIEELLKYVEDGPQKKDLVKQIEWKMIRLDLLKRRSMDLVKVRLYSEKLVRKFASI
ncbi:MAG: DUF1992 domain-containing protein [Candidatus Binatia bacterium]